MFEVLGTFFSSIVSGGATGIIGVIVQRMADYKNKQLDLQLMEKKNAHEIQLRKVDAEIMAQEWTARTKVADLETAARMDVAESEAFAQSFNEPVRYSEGVQPTVGQSWMLVILDFVRGMVRPSLTIYLCIVTTLIYFHAKQMMGGLVVTWEQGVDLLKLVIGTVLYLTTTCVLWWFGTRNKGKGPSGR